MAWLWLAPVLAVALFMGCKAQEKAAADINPVGAYTLVSVNGNQVPCELDHEGHKLAIKSGAFNINADGTCLSKMVFAPPGSSKDATREVKATYTRHAATLTMKWEGAGTTTGTVAGDTFTMNNEGMVLAYRR